MIYPNDRPIGIFDSGIGGLTVARAIRNRLPGEEIIYLGDTARVPYGVKSASTVNRYALESTLFLLNRGVKIVVAACNTVSAVALPNLKNLLKAPIIGVVNPGVRAARQASRNNRIGVIGTPSTIQSEAYPKGLQAEDPAIEVWSQACPLLVPLAEEGKLTGQAVELIMRDYLQVFADREIDTLILGCTHYPLFKPLINNIFESKVTLVDSAETTAVEVESVLLRESLLRTHGQGSLTCFVTDLPRHFQETSRLFFGGDPDRIAKETIGDLYGD